MKEFKFYSLVALIIIACSISGYTDDLMGAFWAIAIWKFAELTWK